MLQKGFRAFALRISFGFRFSVFGFSATALPSGMIKNQCVLQPALAVAPLRRARRALIAAAVLLLGVLPPAPVRAADTAPARAVLNEIMYDPADDRDDLQFVELFNPGTTAADLSGWSLTNGVEFVFPRGTELPAGGCVVVCRDIPAFKSQYGGNVNVAGVFMGKLSHKGESIALVDAGGRSIDTVQYSDRPPWPLGADGYGASLERICPAVPGNDPANWASSVTKPGARADGTPGHRNSCFSAAPLPQISDVHFEQAEPGKPTAVTAAVVDEAGVESAALVWAAWLAKGDMNWSEVTMPRQSGDAHRGIYAGSIPAQPEGRLIRFAVRARSASGAERFCPSKTEPRPTFSCATFVNTNAARIPFLKLETFNAVERPGRSRRVEALVRAGAEKTADLRSQWGSAAIILPPGGKDVIVFDYVHVRARKGGLKVHFHKDQPWCKMTGINIIFESSPRRLLSEPLSYELYRKAGVPAPEAQHMRLWVDDQPFGYYLVVEQPNNSFFRRHGRDEEGNIYKLLWYGRGLVGQHEKKTNPRTGHQDLIQVVEGLNNAAGTDQWDFIVQHFKVDEMINYYAVNMCIQNWDGFFNNYFAYHDLRPGGKWEVIPWDEDKTWGDYDGASRQYDWHDMPLTLGMNGDKPAKRNLFGGWPVAGAEWWRPPGYFSGPLLANPEFRRRFLSRLRELCETLFTPETMGPVIRAMEERLAEEVAMRAQWQRQDPAAALREFRNDIQSFHNQVAQRRKFILQQLSAERP